MATTEQFTLLLVDDNPTNLLLMSEIIELDLPQVRVLKARSGAEGLELAAREPIDGAFIDVQMPRMNGLEMCRRLRQQTAAETLPLVLITAHQAAPELRAEGMALGAYDFITRPISNVEMLARIKVMLRLCAQARKQDKDITRDQDADYERRLNWISGLLLSGNGSAEPPDQQLVRDLLRKLPDPVDLSVEQFYQCLNDDFPQSWGRTLLKLALLPCMPLELARQLSEIADIGAAADYLQRHGLGLTQQPQGQDWELTFTPEVREFLQRRARQELNQAERQQILLQAADWFQQRQQLADALGCLVAAEQYTAVARFFSEFGLALWDGPAAPGILSVVAAIPEETAAEEGWLALFRGIAQRRREHPESRDWLELAYQRFARNDERRGLLLALSQLALLTLFQDGLASRWAERLPVFRKLLEQHGPLLEPLERVQVSWALAWLELLCGGQLRRVKNLLQESLAEAQHRRMNAQLVDLHLLRVPLALHQGRPLVARTAFEQSTQQPSEVAEQWQRQKLVAAELCHASGDLSGLRSQQKGVDYSAGYAAAATLQRPRYLKALQMIARGHHQQAEELVELALADAVAGRGSCFYGQLRLLRGWLRALSGDHAGATRDLAAGMACCDSDSERFAHLENLLLAAALVTELGDYSVGAGYVEQGLQMVQTHDEWYYRPGLLARAALIEQQLGRTEEAAHHFEGFLAALKKLKSTYFWGLSPGLLKQLSELAAQAPAVPEEFDGLLRRYCAQAWDGDDAQAVPLLQVSCLGGFQLQHQERHFDFGAVGQAARMIFALLVLEPGHSMSLARLMEILWPDSSVSRARSSLDTALKRLRQALEGCYGTAWRDTHLALTKGRLTLNFITVDAVDFEREMTAARFHQRRGHERQAELALYRAGQLWQGELLTSYDLVDELDVQRAKLHQLRIEQLEMLSQLLLKRGDCQGALEQLQAARTLDPGRDSLVRLQLTVYRQQRDHAGIRRLLQEYRAQLEQDQYSREDIAELMETLDEPWESETGSREA